VEVSHIEFHQSLWKGLWDAWKIQFMALLCISMAENKKLPDNDFMEVS
jgi:hypothetical protein